MMFKVIRAYFYGWGVPVDLEKVQPFVKKMEFSYGILWGDLDVRTVDKTDPAKRHLWVDAQALRAEMRALGFEFGGIPNPKYGREWIRRAFETIEGQPDLYTVDDKLTLLLTLLSFDGDLDNKELSFNIVKEGYDHNPLLAGGEYVYKLLKGDGAPANPEEAYKIATDLPAMEPKAPEPPQVTNVYVQRGGMGGGGSGILGTMAAVAGGSIIGHGVSNMLFGKENPPTQPAQAQAVAQSRSLSVGFTPPSAEERLEEELNPEKKPDQIPLPPAEEGQRWELRENYTLRMSEIRDDAFKGISFSPELKTEDGRSLKLMPGRRVYITVERGENAPDCEVRVVWIGEDGKEVGNAELGSQQ
jgi:hypothetical protein